MSKTPAIGIGFMLFLCLIGSVPTMAVQTLQPKSDATAEKELEALQGTWYHVSREAGGKETVGERKESVFVVRGKIVVLKTGENVGQVAMIKNVDSASKPKKMDLVITDGANEGLTILSVYEVSGDVFRYCGGIKTRPTSLTTAEDDDPKNYVYCSTYKKLKR
jgi:uncharacterized protein (TIGR03067 family)